MIYTLKNADLTVQVCDRGAELWSIQTADGTQVLWQGDPQIWEDRAPTLFPFVARLWQGKYQLDGQTYTMPIHGFASSQTFVCEKQEDDRLTLALYANEETLKQYPRQFVFRVHLTLEGKTLSITYDVENRDEKTMYFGLGGHPGFCVPLETGKPFEAYQLRFGTPCTPTRMGFSADCFVNGEDAPFALEQGDTISLRHDLFDEDAIVLKDMAREVTLCAGAHGRRITVCYPQMPYLGIWHMPHTEAPYVCIEPWCTLPAEQGEITVFEEKEDMITLPSGKSYCNTWTIRVEEGENKA